MNDYDAIPLMDAAIQYALMGWHVFPVRNKDGEAYHFTDSRTGEKIEVIPRAKSPLTKDGFKNATKNIGKIKYWWNKYPEAGIGVACGKSKIFVIDIDNKEKDGQEVRGMENFMELGIPHLGTWRASTPTDGIHLIYSDPDNIGKSHTNEKLGIDTRGDGGYIVAPHSFVIMPDGSKRRYLKDGEWIGKPKKITQSILDKLPFRKEDSYADKDTLRERVVTEKDKLKVRYYMERMPAEAAWDRENWVVVGSALKNFGELGYELFMDWTEKYFEEKPHSKRRAQVNYQWNSFNGAPYIGSIKMIYDEHK